MKDEKAYAQYRKIDFLLGHGKKPYRLRWKNIKALGRPSDQEFHKAHYFASKREAEQFARNKIDEGHGLGKSADALDATARAKIILEAVRVKNLGIDPILAMEEGLRHLKAYGEHGERKIGEYWPAYVERKRGDCRWGSLHALAQKSFFESTKKGLMQQPVKNFINVQEGKRVVRKALETYQHSELRNAANTLKGVKSKIRSFLSFIASQGDALKRAHLVEIFADEYLLPKGLRREAQNVAITAEQAEYLIGYLAPMKLAGWIVLKLFMGARTMLLQKWKWSVVDWETKRMIIPRDQTKLKKSDIIFHFGDIPNFESWLIWAWQKDGCPSAEMRIARRSQPTITNLVSKAINQKRNLFGEKDQRNKIKPVDCLRNFMRSGFITYGIENPSIGMGKVMKIAEDTHNLHKYLAWDSSTGRDPESNKFWALKPEQIQPTTGCPCLAGEIEAIE
jgi:hypothetical protein